MHRERLSHLITILEGVRDERKAFNINVWLDRIKPSRVIGDINECGTACCALGYAALDPQFRAEGLKLVARYSKTWRTNAERKTTSIGSPADFVAIMREAEVYSVTPAFQGACSYDAAVKFFGLAYENALKVFSPLSYGYLAGDADTNTPTTPDMVIARIQELLA